MTCLRICQMKWTIGGKQCAKKKTIIKEQSEDVNDEEIFYHDVAKLHNVNTANWPIAPQQRGLVMISAECVKLDFWVDQKRVRTTCQGASCVTPEEYNPAPKDEAEAAELSVLAVEWKQNLDSKLDKLETGMTRLQDRRGNEIEMMKLMLKAQNVPEDFIKQ